MPKTLYLMRHGQTLFNRQHKIQGACDSPLTTQGIADAKSVGQYFQTKGIVFDHAYTSTQERAEDTLKLVTSQPYQRLKGLKEWNFGEFEGESERLNPPFDPKVGSMGDAFVPYGGEGADQVQARMVKTLTNVMQQEDNQQVLAVGHGGAIYLFLKQWLSLDEIVKHTDLHNCTVLKFSFDGHDFTYETTINVV